MNFLKGEFFKCCGLGSGFPETSLPEVVFVGKSNVGKSSIINRIFSLKHIAKTSSSPGKTATINFYRAENGFLVDLPGYGYAKVSKAEKQKWADLIHSYYFSKRNIRLNIIIIDSRRGVSDFDRQMVNFLIELGLDFIIVLNKIDKLKKADLNETLKSVSLEFANFKIIKFSVKTMEGLDELKETILSFVN